MGSIDQWEVGLMGMSENVERKVSMKMGIQGMEGCGEIDDEEQ